MKWKIYIGIVAIAIIGLLLLTGCKRVASGDLGIWENGNQVYHNTKVRVYEGQGQKVITAGNCEVGLTKKTVILKDKQLGDFVEDSIFQKGVNSITDLHIELEIGDCFLIWIGDRMVVKL